MIQQSQQPAQNTYQNVDKKVFNTNEKPKDVRKANILAAKGNDYFFNPL
jgi:hypothetical protein